MDRITDLFKSYVENRLSKQEEAELWELIGSGKYADKLGQAIDEVTGTDNIGNIAVTDRVDPEKIKYIREHILHGGPPLRTKVVSMRNTWTWMAAAAAVVIVIVSYMWVYRPLQPATTAHVTNAGGREYHDLQYIALPDGTRVTLNNGGTLSYNADFGNTTREVTLTGEAFFDVMHDPDRPFIVHTGAVNTTVLGTAFNVTYEAGRQVVVTVTRGKVSVGDDRQVYSAILPNEQLTVNTVTNKFEKTTPGSDEALAWQRGFLILDKVTMQEAARLIGERFHTQVTIKNEGLKNCIVTASFMNGEGVSHVLTSLALVMQAKCEKAGKDFVITGGKTCD